MTASERHTHQCALCASTNEPSVGSAPAWMEGIDLDTRGTDGREILQAHSCLACGYCADDLNVGGLLEQAVVRSERYQAQLNHADFPPAANRYLCIDLLAQASWDWQRACWACIHAAWVCDDLGLADAARQCRLWALNRMGQALDSGQMITSQPGTPILLRLDLLRRSQRFEQATRLLEREAELVAGGAAKPSDGSMLQRILHYQHHLVASGDHRRHSLVDMARWEARSVN